MAEAYIVAATRTAGGRKGGRMRGWHPADLAGSVLDELIVRTGIDHVDGRKVHAIGWIEGLDGVRYTDASAIYIRLTPEQEAAFVAAAAERDYTMPDAY